MVPGVWTTPTEKDQTSFMVRELVRVLDAHTVVAIMEIWTLPKGISMERAQALYKQYGELANVPERVEAVRVLIEERNGRVADAVAPIVRQGRAVKLAAPIYRDLTRMEGAGRFTGWFGPMKPVPGFDKETP
jgi:hypothetical protein